MSIICITYGDEKLYGTKSYNDADVYSIDNNISGSFSKWI